jgi:Tol biopolymer transport system component
MPWGADAITIWGLDGTVRMTLPVPAGYSDWRELGMRWAPDGRAVLAALTKGSGAVSAREVWRLPVDRSTPDRLPDDHPYARWDPAVSPEGNRIAYSGLNDPDVRRSIYVANVDGSEPRAVPATAQTNGDPGFPRWSPDGTRLEYAVGLSQGGLRYALHVVEIASGVDTIVLEGLDDGWGNIEWSPDGEWLLVRALDVGPTVHGIVPGGPVKTNLWRVHPDGSGLLRLVDDIEAFDVVR